MDSRQIGDALPRLVEQLVESYFAEPRTHHIDKDHLPSRAAIVRICDLLLTLTYPGFFGRRGLTRHNIRYHVGELLPKLWEDVAEQIAQCLHHYAELAAAPAAPAGAAEPVAGDAPAAPKPGDLCRRNAAAMASRFLERIPTVRKMLADDVQAAFDGDPAAEDTAEVILAYPGIIAITLHRYAHELYEMDVPLMPRIMSEHAHQLTGIDIHPGAKIGPLFFIDHGTGVVIGETAEIGVNCKMYQGVTLGALSFPKDARGRIIRGTKRHPTIGDNCTIYANAIVLGGNTMLGEGCIVGGSVFLTQSVEPGHQVSISPPVLRVRPPQRSADAGPPA